MIIRVGHVDSTQRIARALLEDGADHGTVVVARSQSAGRGRRGRAWVSAELGLYASWVLRPKIDARRAPLLTMCAAAAIVKALDGLGVTTSIKWPNDIVVPHDVPGPLGPFRKLGGILVEAVELGEKLESAVLGVGINVKGPVVAQALPPQPEREAIAGTDPLPRNDHDLSMIASSLFDVGYRGTVDDVFAAIVERLDAELARDPLDPLPFVRARSATLGRRVEVDGVVGDAVRIDNDGALVLQDDAGEHVLHAGDVKVKSL